MLTARPSPAPAPIDVLLVGGLAIDRFDDGRVRPGGAVIHVTRAAATRGLRIAVLTAAGPEPVAREAAAELRQQAARAAILPAPETMAFRHHEADGTRRLWLARRGAPLRVPSRMRDTMGARAILFAPLADELEAAQLGSWAIAGPHAAILQGWLRIPHARRELEARPLRALGPELVAALAALDLLVASREDLAAEEGEPPRLVERLRERFGPGPTIVVTDGPAGAWLQGPQDSQRHGPFHVAPPRRVDGVATVGAGDILAAFMLRGGWRDVPDPAFLTRRIGEAMRVVVDVLEARRADSM